MKPLHGKKCYLSAPIEYENNTYDWRPDIKKKLVDRFSLDIFDPFSDPKQSKADELNKAKEAEDFDTVAEIAQDFVHKDLGWVDRVDMLIANLPYRVPTVGTIHEIINALDRKIPTLIVCTQGKKFLPSWLFGVMKKKHKQYMYGSWEDMFNYLEEVNNNLHKNDRRWSFVYGLV